MKNLLLLHGALGSARQFDAIKDQLGQDVEVHAFHFEGHGGRESSRNFRMEHFVSNVLDYMHNQQIEMADIFGYSMGGYVALKMALTYPEKVGKIFTLGTKFDWNPAATAKEIQMLDPDTILEKVPHYAQFLEKVHHPQNWKVVLSQTAEMMGHLSKEGQLKQGDFEQINHQVHVCVGEIDKMVSHTFAQAVASQLPNATFEMLPQAPHPLQKIDPNVLIPSIQIFFSL